MINCITPVQYQTLWIKASAKCIYVSRWGIFVAIAKNTLYGTKLLIFDPKSLGY